MLNNPHRFATVASGCSVGAPLGRLLMHSAKIAIIPLSSQRDSNVSQIKDHFQTGRCCCRGNCFIISRLSFTGEKTPPGERSGLRMPIGCPYRIRKSLMISMATCWTLPRKPKAGFISGLFLYLKAQKDPAMFQYNSIFVEK